MKALYDLPDDERFLLFMALIAPTPEVKIPTLESSTEELLKWFGLMTGWDYQRCLSAYEVGIVKGNFGRKPKG